MTTGMNNEAEHVWGAPMAGQGNSRVCKICGGRYAVASDTPCPGSRIEQHTAEISQHEYDPLEDRDG